MGCDVDFLVHRRHGTKLRGRVRTPWERERIPVAARLSIAHAIGVAGPATQETQTEWVPGWVGVDLKVITLRRTSSRAEHAGAQIHHTLVRLVEVFHPQVEMNLLRR